MRSFFVLSSVFLALVPRSSAEPGRETRANLAGARATCKTNFIYDSQRKDGDHLADVCYVKTAASAKPKSAVILVHGSNLCHRDMWAFGERLIRQGRVVMSIGYAADHCDGDVTQAVRWLRANAGDFNIDSKRISLFGYSYGAMCSTWAALAYAHVRSVVVLSGAMTVEPWWSLDGAPPFFFVHGEDDGIVRFNLALEEHSAFLNHSLDSTLLTFPNGGHRLAELHMEEIMNGTAKFFDRTLGRTRRPSSCPACREKFLEKSLEQDKALQAAPFNETGYQVVVAYKDADLMADFITRVIANGGGWVDRSHKDADLRIRALARWYSGENGDRSFQELLTTLRKAKWALNQAARDWVSTHHAPVPDSWFEQKMQREMRAPMGAQERAVHKQKANSVSLDKPGYKEMLALRDTEAMARFIARVIDDFGGFYDVSIDANVHGLATWYSGETSANGFDALLSELRRKPWALAPAGLKRAQVRKEAPEHCNMTLDVEDRVEQAPFTEEGYNCVAALTDDGHMSHFILRIIEQNGGLLTNESMGSVGGLAHWYSGENGVQTYERLMDELQHMDWALSPNAPKANATVAAPANASAPGDAETETPALHASSMLDAHQHRKLRGTDTPFTLEP